MPGLLMALVYARSSMVYDYDAPDHHLTSSSICADAGDLVAMFVCSRVCWGLEVCCQSQSVLLIKEVDNNISHRIDQIQHQKQTYWYQLFSNYLMSG